MCPFLDFLTCRSPSPQLGIDQSSIIDDLSIAGTVSSSIEDIQIGEFKGDTFRLSDAWCNDDNDDDGGDSGVTTYDTYDQRTDGISTISEEDDLPENVYTPYGDFLRSPKNDKP